MRRLLGLARHLYWAAFNVRLAVAAAIFGANQAEMRRLERKGVITRGPQTYGHPEVLDFGHGVRLRVGNYSSLGGTYLLGGAHASNYVTTYPHRINWRMEGAGEDGFPMPSGDTVVGSDVWTCMGCLIRSGVTIGDGAIVGAGAVVVKDVPPYAIVGGNPAQLIRYRFDEAQRTALLEIRWWDWPEDEVRAAVPLLADEDVDAFIAYARERGQG